MLRLTTAARAKKYVAVQACYSGGFITSDEAKFRVQALSTLENTTIMTASRHDRPSFGCDPGDERTEFGGAFTDAIKRQGVLPQHADWNSLHKEVTQRVTELEKKYQAKAKKGFLPSEPQFFESPTK